MPFYFTPHSPQWFKALESFDPSKAAITRMVVEITGSLDVCSICGDDPAYDYQLVDKFMQKNAVATIRLCDDCLRIKKKIHRERFILYKHGIKSP
jgi:hypothetical protein